MKKIPALVLVLFFAASGAQASIFSPIFKIGERIFARKGAAKVVEKTAMTHLDDAARVAGHNADDLAKAGARGGAKAGTGALARTGGMVERSIAAERAAARAAAPAVPEIHRTVIVPPKTVLAGGAAVAGTVAAHNLTIGERKKDEAVADGIRNDPGAAERIASGGFFHMLGAGGGRALVVLAWLLGGGIGLSKVFRSLPLRRPRPAVIDVTAESTVR